MRLGGGVKGQMRVRLGGAPLPERGLQLTGSQVDLSAPGMPSAMAGQIASLSGSRFKARATDQSGTVVDLDANVNIDQSNGTVTGTLTGNPGRSTAGSRATPASRGCWRASTQRGPDVARRARARARPLPERSPWELIERSSTGACAAGAGRTSRPPASCARWPAPGAPRRSSSTDRRPSRERQGPAAARAAAAPRARRRRARGARDRRPGGDLPRRSAVLRVAAGVEGALALRDDRVHVHSVQAVRPEATWRARRARSCTTSTAAMPLPTFVPPRPFERGFRGRPTLIQNPETLAQLALVARFGEHWYRELGTARRSRLGAGDDLRRGPRARRLRAGVRHLDAVTWSTPPEAPTEPLRALLVGGYFGTWVDGLAALDLRLAREDLRSVGCTLGAGVLIALGESSCGLAARERPRDRLPRAAIGRPVRSVRIRAAGDRRRARRDADGVADARDRAQVARWASEVRGRGA